ncbi:toll/interleukin-1 receptor domain-containing protein [Caballeronia sp. LZ062]|uniref:toll/interleukin-1 receptor domain-containing protein n=1 Tax=unclassified Caballeronia TaxID=2646786 RepID=UPI0028594B21|nr:MULTISPECIES: toll/interleukin-1 receptor domain-containing protein [unclassified Caballeronia]MDR5857259.1 toll/interleukin-1 receptor domain-containing protein [Caballeronia sp. LZ050]MDR5868810.1 toll/interleukin-1 receptor domain-containing protein [Caballeronia sp. LZ062]
MKVFLSWSGQRSREVAELLNDWISCVLQAARPWISTHDIASGTIWFSEIQAQLAETSVGIVCLTQENKTKPWILFEAGALAKGISASRVCTFLVDLKHADVENPLAQFNHTLPDQQGLRHLARTLNAAMPVEHRLRDDVLDRVFVTYWPQFEQSFASVLRDVPAAAADAPPRSDNSMLAEILEHTRSLSGRVAQLERGLSISGIAPESFSDLITSLDRTSDTRTRPVDEVFHDKVNKNYQIRRKRYLSADVDKVFKDANLSDGPKE